MRPIATMAEPPVSAHGILNQSFATLQKLKSWRYDVIYHSTFGDVHSNVTFRHSGDRYRIDRQDTSVGAINGDPLKQYNASWAYDGDRFQKLDHDQGIFTESSSGNGGAADPLLCCYDWLFAAVCKSKSHPLLRSRQLWEDFARLAKLDGAERHGDFSCVIVRRPQLCSRGRYEFRVWLDRENGFPVKSERVDSESGQLASRVTVPDWQNVQLPQLDAPLPFPTHVVFQQWDTGDGGAAFRDVHRIATDSMEINEPIDAGVFDLSVSPRIASRRDVDATREKLDAIVASRPAAIRPDLPFWYRYRFALTAVNVALILLALMMIWRRKRT